jgi:hypothetical protein
MNYYVKLDSGSPAVGSYPMLEANLKDILSTNIITDEILAENNYARVASVNKAEFLLPWQNTMGMGFSLEDGEWHFEEEIANKTELSEDDLDMSKKYLKNILSAFRYSKETAGIDFNGNNILTNEASQRKIYDTYTATVNGLISEVEWKLTKEGPWIALSADDVATIAANLINHVNKCYSAEKQVSLAIDGLSDAEGFNNFDCDAQFQAAFDAL